MSTVEIAGRWLIARSGRTVAGLCALALFIELAQEWPEFIWGAHAVGEVIGNLVYAMIGALLFHWLVVRLPEERRQRAAYEGHRMALQFLATVGAMKIQEYRLELAARGSGVQVDAWDRRSVFEAAEAIAELDTQFFFASSHFQVLGHTITAVQESLDGMAPSMSFFDPDVTHALGLFPGKRGIEQLQIPERGTSMDPEGLQHLVNRSAHIAWELLEGGRRLVDALDNGAPDLDFELEKATIRRVYGTKLLERHLSLADLRRTQVASE